jgi:plastocyanin
MPRLPLAALGFLIAALFVVAACSSESAPGWTYAPAPSVTAAPSGAASGEPSAPASAGASPTASAEPTESAEPTGDGGTTLTVTAPEGAATTGFDPDELEAPANAPFTVVFDNQDTTTSPHNWVLRDSSGANIDIGDTAFFSGPEQREYQVPALEPGEYSYICEVHATTMTGTLTAG